MSKQELRDYIAFLSTVAIATIAADISETRRVLGVVLMGLACIVLPWTRGQFDFLFSKEPKP